MSLPPTSQSSKGPTYAESTRSLGIWLLLVAQEAHMYKIWLCGIRRRWVRFLTEIAPDTPAHLNPVYLGSSYVTNFLCIKGPLLGTGVYHATFWLRTRPTCAEFRYIFFAI